MRARIYARSDTRGDINTIRQLVHHTIISHHCSRISRPGIPSTSLTHSSLTVLLYVHRTEVAYWERGGGGGGKRAREWRLDGGYRPKKTGETVDRRQNNGIAIAQWLVHCAIAVSAAVVGRVTRTMSVALLLRNNPKLKKSNFRSPAPPPCSWSLLG